MASLPEFRKFVVHGEETSAGTRWKKWIAQLENLLCGLDINNDARKKALLLHYGGDEIFDIVHTMSEEDQGIGSTVNTGTPDVPVLVPNEYAVLKTSLSDHFTPKKNTSYETFKFRQTVQNQDESIDTFATRLRTMASLCDFRNADREILAQIIQGCSSTRLRRKALKDDMSLTNVLAEARALELSDARAAEIETVVAPATVHALYNPQRPSRPSGSQHGDSHQRFQTPAGVSVRGPSRGDELYRQRTSSSQNSRRCRYCGGATPHWTGCPAKGKDCKKCGKI
eukprot:TRINITY_DN48507_c1_g1_i2.p1 TRINITY_DN48507_c1_g1~~TRINITY_DN48507_c1_g1_i2.p1  ORF type:complete len:283 (-),score=41.55 TRINITY_DN48507_c1_g1_i2:214-1062(-)